MRERKGKGRREGEREKRARKREKGGKSTGNHNKHIKTAMPAVLINMATQQYLWLATDTTPHTDPHNTRATIKNKATSTAHDSPYTTKIVISSA